MTIDLDAIKARRAAIGKCNWELAGGEAICIDGTFGCNTSTYAIGQHIAFSMGKSLEGFPLIERTVPLPLEAEFIINAPADIDALVAEVERLRSELAKEKKGRDDVCQPLSPAEAKAAERQMIILRGPPPPFSLRLGDL